MKINTLKNSILTFTIAGMLTFNTLPVDAALGDTILKEGMQHDDIKVLQQLLKDSGYFHDDETTTYYGDITLNAVLDFQKSQSLNQDGIFGPETYEALKAISYSSDVEEEVVDIAELAKTVDNISLLYTRDLKLEIKGDDVNKLQEALKKLGYLIIENTTEYFGPQTEEALISFQKSYEIDSDGIAGYKTIDVLNEVLVGKRPVIAAPTRGDVGNRSLTINVINTAKKLLGSPYVYGGSSIKGFDCSGFTQYVYKQNGINVPRDTVSQAKIGTKISRADLQPGDLIIFSNTYKKGPSHAGIYIGGDQFIHASTSKTGVIISDLNSAHYSSHFTYGQRVY